jgi:hypothetical protein
MAWRYLAQRMDGTTGLPGAWLDKQLPLMDASVTLTLSGPQIITGKIDPVYKRLLASDGKPILDRWDTAIYAEDDSQTIRGGGIYSTGGFAGSAWSLTCTGFAGYIQGMGYEGTDQAFINTDPLDVVRFCWTSLQAGQQSNIGLSVDNATTTDVRVGVAATGDSQNGPLELNWWSTDDMGKVIDDLAKSTPFDYRETHAWNGPRTAVDHGLTFGYPRLGQQRDLRFVIGENIQTEPPLSDDGSFANHIRYFGAGQGRDVIRAETMIDDGRLRRMAVVDNKDVQYTEQAQKLAGRELGRHRAFPTLTNVVVRDTPATPLGSWDVGDDILIQGQLQWTSIYDWYRVIGITLFPDKPEIISMSLIRVDAL